MKFIKIIIQITIYKKILNYFNSINKVYKLKKYKRNIQRNLIIINIYNLNIITLTNKNEYYIFIDLL